MYNIVKKRNIWFSLSGLLLAAGLVFIIMGGLKLGIDFTGGTLIQIEFAKERPGTEEIKESLKDMALGEIKVKQAGENDIVIRLATITNEQRSEILKKFTDSFGGVTEKNFDSIGPIIGQELKQKAYTAIGLVLAGIILYISWAFRKISTLQISSWLFGVNAIIALVHDILITLGVFAALGYFFGIEIDIYFVTALLTILGFSVHDTIVVFDRVREGIKNDYHSPFDEIVNKSINETIVRSLNTSLTTLLVLLALFLFGGETIRFFVLALIIGVIFGTYSSIFIASPLLTVWSKIRKK